MISFLVIVHLLGSNYADTAALTPSAFVWAKPMPREHCEQLIARLEQENKRTGQPADDMTLVFCR